MNNIEDLSVPEYRKFGLSFAVVILLFFFLLLPWIFAAQQPHWPWFVSSLLLLWALLAPGSLHYLYKPWMRFAHVLGFINTRLLLGLIFILIFVPIALVFKLFRVDPLDRQVFTGQVDSYWKNSKQAESRSMENVY
tara:strand:- start:1779 stop:2186 length:408 start_codon:yes stop_codon:yes gene_type:complete